MMYSCKDSQESANDQDSENGHVAEHGESLHTCLLVNQLSVGTLSGCVLPLPRFRRVKQDFHQVVLDHGGRVAVTEQHVEDTIQWQGCHAHGFAWAGYTDDSNSAAGVPCMAPGVFDTKTYRPINITSRICGPPPPWRPPERLRA